MFRRYGPGFRKRQRMPRQQLRVMRAIETCRTSALGGHVERCGHCQHQRIGYNSCRNRHCPKCQTMARAKWVQRRKGELLPIEYFHVVFTIPEQLNAVALQNPEIVYKMLFDITATTLQTIAADPKHLGARIGFFSILLTTSEEARLILSGDKVCSGLRPNGHGGRTCFIIHMCTVSSPAAA